MPPLSSRRLICTTSPKRFGLRYKFGTALFHLIERPALRHERIRSISAPTDQP
jgi:hypothetical protein